MVKIDAEVSRGYGGFVRERLKDYIPQQKRKKVYYEYEKDTQKIVTDYKNQIKSFENKLWHWHNEYNTKGGEFTYRFTIYEAIFFVILLFAGLPMGDAGAALSVISLLALIWIIHSFAACDFKYKPPSGIMTYNSKRELIPIDGGLDAPYLALAVWDMASTRVIGPQPKPPVKPDNYPKGKPNVTKTKPDKRNRDDEWYDQYIETKRKCQTEVNCPICNHLIQFTEVRKPPFEDKCESCDYSFTFIYRKRTERYIEAWVAGDKAEYIYYDGIKLTRPRAPFKGEHISGAKRQPIPQDVKDKVWNRDEGKCTQCGSNENLEFDHIIPVSKGGANTYRNIQLLCEVCNREKSDNIG